jgi:hypothetical protein
LESDPGFAWVLRGGGVMSFGPVGALTNILRLRA